MHKFFAESGENGIVSTQNNVFFSLSLPILQAIEPLSRFSSQNGVLKIIQNLKKLTEKTMLQHRSGQEKNESERKTFEQIQTTQEQVHPVLVKEQITLIENTRKELLKCFDVSTHFRTND